MMSHELNADKCCNIECEFRVIALQKTVDFVLGYILCCLYINNV